MDTVRAAREWLEDQLPKLAVEYDVPAVAVAFTAGGQTVDVATGTLSTSTGVDATPDSVFQIGSITKLWTASLVMQLVEEDRLDLDAPVRRYLPQFRLAEESAAQAITTRQLLSHTAGFEGDIFTDTGEGSDCLELFLDHLADVPQLFAPGEQFSYNNAGYCVLGRLVEVLRDRTYDSCLREHLITPLGLTHVATGAAEAILFRAAVGHLKPSPDAEQQPAPVWALPRSNAPAGSRLAMRARDLVGFARLHLNADPASDQEAVLAPGTMAAMQQRQVELPRLRVFGDAWGLGWELYDTAGPGVIGHDGTTLGQASFLRLVPERGVAVALLTNGGDAHALYRDVMARLLADLAGVELPALPVPPADPPPVDAARYVGVYASRVADLIVTQDGDRRVWVEMKPSEAFPELGQSGTRSELVAFEPDMLIPREPEQGLYLPHAFLGDDGAGHARFLHIGRAMPRVRD